MVRIFGHFIPSRTLILAVLDAIALAGLIILSQKLWYLVCGSEVPVVSAEALPFVLAVFGVVSIWIMGFYRANLRLGYAAGIIGALSAGVLAMGFGATIIIAFGFSPGVDQVALLRWITIPMTVFVFGVCVARARFIWAGNLNKILLKRQILLIGDGPRAAAVGELAGATNIEIKKRLGGGDLRKTSAESVELLSPEALHREKIREVVVATEEQRGLPMQALMRCRLHGIRVIDYLTFCERESGYVDLDALQPSWIIYGDGCRQGLWAKSVKRVFDIVVSITLLTLAAPLMALVALLIAFESRGPIFYAQERVGLGGRVFTLLKFRSMRTDAESTAAPVWARKRDPRITRVGAVLRPMRLDELPQLINVLRGDMSLVGPRPERPFFVDQLLREIPFYGFRHVIKPGLTGWAQINAPYAASIAETRTKLCYDLYYIKNRSFFLDLRIALATVRVVLLQEGAV